MPLNSATVKHNGFINLDSMNSELESEYDYLREELKRLMTEPIKDFPRIDRLVDRLERLQLAIKEEHGIKGNNPNE
jgi:predicted nuclease with TOPRIM domain